jgi:hypothetical protein
LEELPLEQAGLYYSILTPVQPKVLQTTSMGEPLSG